MCRSKHVEPSVNFGIINSITKLHLVGISTYSPDILSVDQFTLHFRSVHKIARSGYELRHVRPSVRLSAWNNPTSTGRIFIKFCICVFFENLLRKFKFPFNLTKITGTLPEYLCTIMIISRGILLIMRNVTDRSCQENENTFCSQ